jgi:amino acid transporter
VRAVAWLIVVCALAAATGVFLPSLELRAVHTRHGELSLYAASTERQLARRVIAAYHGNRARGLVEAIGARAMKHTRGRVHEALDDATSAMSSLDEVSDRDVAAAGTALVVAIWGFLGLEAAIAVLVLGQLAGDVVRKRRRVAVIALGVLASLIAVALLLVVREVAWQVNDELGAAAVVAGPGAWVMALAALGGLACAIAVAVVRQPANSAASSAGDATR